MKKLLIITILILTLGFISGEAFINPALESSFNSYQTQPVFQNFYSTSDFADFWPIINDMREGRCEAVTDFAVMIPPGGCTPPVVRSDLLAEQNVPVFCRLVAVQLNPLIRTSSIRSITFSRDNVKGVAGVRFYPARAGANVISNTLLNNPIANEIGYVVIILQRTPNESAQQKWISGNLTANLVYDVEQAFGLGKSEFYLDVLTDEEWNDKAIHNSFWLGKGFVRLLDVDKEKARIAIYLNDKDRPYREITLREGETSNILYLPGLYCMAGIKIRLNEVSGIDDKALLKINEDLIWVRKNTNILNGRCRVVDFSIDPMETGDLKLRCSGVNKDIILQLKSALKTNLTVGNQEKIFNIGDVVLENVENKKWYLVYSTEKSKSRISNERREYAVLISENKDRELNFEKTKRLKETINKLENFDFSSFDELVQRLERESNLKNGSDFVVLFTGREVSISENKLKLNSVSTRDPSERKDPSISSDNKQKIEELYQKYEQIIKNLERDYKGTKEPNSQNSFAETAYVEQIELLTKLVELGLKTETELNQLRGEFLEKFPSSSYSSKIRLDLYTSRVYDRENSSVVVNINGIFNVISLERFERASNELKKAELFIDNKKFGDVKENEVYNLTFKDGNKKGDYFVVNRIMKDYIEISYMENSSSNDGKQKYIERKERIGLETKREIGIERKYEFYLRKIDLPLTAHVSLIPEERGARGQANFTFKIGVEKRMFEITPERANKSLERLNKSIKEWEKKLENLGNLVTTWKTTCFFTGLGLNVKNLITGASGKALARQEVMKFYREFCSLNIEGKNKEVAISECYNEHKDEINKNIDAYAKAIQEVNNEIKGKSLEEFKKTNPQYNNYASWSEIKNVMLFEKFKKNGGREDSIIGANLKANSDGIKARIKERVEEEQRRQGMIENMRKETGIGEGVDINPIVFEEQNTREFGRSGIQGRVSSLPGNLNEKQYEVVSIGGVTYLVGLTAISATEFTINEELVFKKNTQNVWEKVNWDDRNNDLKQKLSQIRIKDGDKCEFPYRLEPVVRYFGEGPNKGLPAIVPFDKEKGWYVRVSASQGDLFSQEVKGYYESGVVRFFYICNVGPNGREENMGGDDICQSFDINNYDKVNTFLGCSGLTKYEIKRLGDDAQQAIRYVSSLYNDVISKNINTISIQVGNRKRFDAKIDRTFVVDRPIAECYDFMSIDDCNLLFNVCDPVICPTSRCDFGGKMPVDNVIASGVAGSIFLCLPNFGSPSKGGVLVPVCLTGIHAGLDAYVSILRAQYQCMDEAMKTGKYVGVCDYITAVYKCEFFWRNAQPIMKSLVPKALEFINDPSSLFAKKGGGEYLTFQKSWDNMEKSLDYFKNRYAGTSFRRLEFSDVQEVGSEVCRRFIGTSIPTKANMKDVFAPDSPTQFYAEFSEITFTEATVPPTSQYKVLYHIYAGNDQAVSYRVYLKDPPASSFYQGNPTVLIASGVINRGKFVSESKDFTAPAGYKQLCVELNGKEKCGFKQVTSDVGLEYLTKIQAKKEAEKRDITTEKECISGTPNVLGLTSSSNVQEGIQSSLTPEIHRMGVVRICATENPGKGVQDSNKWIEVGYCGNPNIKCWLSTDSINRDTIGLINSVGSVKKAENILTKEDELARDSEAKINNNLNEVERKISNLNDVNEVGGIEKELNEIDVRSALDYQLARKEYLRAKLYEKAIKVLLRVKERRTAIEPVTPSTTSSDSTETSSTKTQDDSNRELSSLRNREEVVINGENWRVSRIDNQNKRITLYKIENGRTTTTTKVCSIDRDKTLGKCFS